MSACAFVSILAPGSCVVVMPFAVRWWLVTIGPRPHMRLLTLRQLLAPLARLLVVRLRLACLWPLLALLRLLAGLSDARG